MPIDAGECHDPDLRLYVLQRILQTWRQHSSGSSLVHAVSVLGWRHAIAAAGDVADVMEQHVQSLFPRTTASSRQSGGHISSVGEGAEAARSSNPLNGGAGVAALFAARRRLMYARGFMADFPTHMPCEATAGSSISIGAAASTNRVLGCIFVDWRGCALKQRRYRTIRVGTHSKVLDESRGELQRYLFRALAAWHQLTVQTRAELQAAEVTTPLNPPPNSPPPPPLFVGCLHAAAPSLSFQAQRCHLVRQEAMERRFRRTGFSFLLLDDNSADDREAQMSVLMYLHIIGGFH
jgi:hypothetical protein